MKKQEVFIIVFGLIGLVLMIIFAFTPRKIQVLHWGREADLVQQESFLGPEEWLVTTDHSYVVVIEKSEADADLTIYGRRQTINFGSVRPHVGSGWDFEDQRPIVMEFSNREEAERYIATYVLLH